MTFFRNHGWDGIRCIKFLSVGLGDVLVLTAIAIAVAVALALRRLENGFLLHPSYDVGLDVASSDIILCQRASYKWPRQTPPYPLPRIYTLVDLYMAPDFLVYMFNRIHCLLCRRFTPYLSFLQLSCLLPLASETFVY